MVLLVVEDDPHYARILVDLAHDNGFKVLVAATGADALVLANDYHPTAVSLDVFLPDMLGWTVLSQLKQNPATRHIPVQIVTLEEERQHGVARSVLIRYQARHHGGIAGAISRIRLASRDATAPGRRRQRGRALQHHR
jgi:CheY-like chemotaxis protein